MSVSAVKSRKLQRERDQRRALTKNLATALIEYETIETTRARAQVVVPYVEKLITKAKKGDLHNRRQIIAALDTVEAAHKLVDDIAPKLGARNSGYLRRERVAVRSGDNAQLVRISFVDDLDKPAPKAESKKTAKPPTPKPAAKKSAPKKETKE